MSDDKDIIQEIRERDAYYVPLLPHIRPDSHEMAYTDRHTLLSLVDALRAENAKLRRLLRDHGQHDYVCSSEHGRFPKRCDCWFAALAAKEKP